MATSTVFSSGFSPILYAQSSDEFQALSAAASKAEEAASRYETHTTGLLQARSPSLQRDDGETSDMSANRHIPTNTPPTSLDNPESYQRRHRGDNIQNRLPGNADVTRPLAHGKSSSPPILEGSLNPGDCIEAPRDGGLAPALNTNKPWNGESSSKKREFDLDTQNDQKNPAFVSSARVSKTQSLESQSSSDPLERTTSTSSEGARPRKWFEKSQLTSKRMDQRRQHVLPKSVLEWMNGAGSTPSESTFAQSSSEKSKPFRDNGAPKPRSAHTQTSSPCQTTPGAFGTPRQMSNTQPTQSPISDALKTSSPPKKKSSVQDLGLSATANLKPLPLHLADDLAFVQVFKDIIYPSIKASEKAYQGIIPEDILRTIGKSVSN